MADESPQDAALTPVKAPPVWMRRTFGAVSLLAAAVAVYLGLQTDVSAPQPAWALGSPPFEKVAVIVALFAAFYVILAVLYLAFQGRPFTKIGVAGATVEAPDVLAEAAVENTDAVDDLNVASAELARLVADHENRLRKLEGLPPVPELPDGA